MEFFKVVCDEFVVKGFDDSYVVGVLFGVVDGSKIIVIVNGKKVNLILV